jgi:hypothetical protein
VNYPNFYQKVWTIQSKFKLNSFPDFVIQNPLGIWTSSQKDSCSFWFSLAPCDIWWILEFRKDGFGNFHVPSRIEKFKFTDQRAARSLKPTPGLHVSHWATALTLGRTPLAGEMLVPHSGGRRRFHTTPPTSPPIKGGCCQRRSPFCHPPRRQLGASYMTLM